MKPRVGTVLVALLVLTGCFGDRADTSVYVASGITGRVQFRSLDGTAFEPLHEGERLAEGSVIRVLSESTATLERGSESFIRLRPVDPSERCSTLRGTERVSCLADAATETAPAAQMKMVTIDRFDVSSGDVLVKCDPAAPIEVASGGVEASTEEGTFRFDRRLSLRIAVYEGTANVEAAGSVLALPSLREGVVAGRELPREPSLLQFRRTDPWDRELLKDVIDLDNELNAQRTGYEAEFGATTDADGVQAERRALRTMAGERSVRFIDPRDHRSGNILIGLVFALLLEDKGRGSLADVYGSLFDLLDQGATWGFLARDNAITSEELIGGVVRAIGLRTGEVDPDTSIVGPSPTPSGTNSRTPGPTTSAKPTRTAKPSPTPTKTTSPKPSKSPSPSPTPSPSESCVPVGPICL